MTGGPNRRHPRYLVVGSSYAGTRAAIQLARENPDADVTIVGGDLDGHYDRTEVSKGALAAEPVVPRRFVRAEDLAAAGVRAALGHPAVRIDPHSHVVTDAAGQHYPYDRALIATGSVPANPWSAVAGARVLHSAADAAGLQSLLQPGARVVIVGAGLIGLEVAAAARARDCEVTAVDEADGVLAGHLPRPVGQLVRTVHATNEVRFILNTATEVNASASGGRTSVSLAGGELIQADVTVIAVGMRPNVDWLRGTALEIDRCLVCDMSLTTSNEDVLVAGDAAQIRGATSTLMLEHVTAATETAQTAATNMTRHRADRTNTHITGFFWSDFYGHRLQVLGAPTPADDFCWLARNRVGFCSRAGVCTAVVLVDAADKIREARSQLGQPIAHLHHTFQGAS